VIRRRPGRCSPGHARDAKLNAVTAGRYLDLLEASFLVRRLPLFLKNRSSRLVKSPKCFDSQLRLRMLAMQPGHNARSALSPEGISSSPNS
jgi:predicted AAA+ superfamily ATPase